MAVFRLSRLAAADLMEIGAYTLNSWGDDQVVRYLNDLEACCQRLADNPQMGRACDEVRPGLRRMEHAQHVVFYRQEAGAFWFLGSFINVCLSKHMLSEMETTIRGNAGNT